jgi:protein-S-isoprenylcysteine O-methyltransferase Ste14
VVGKLLVQTGLWFGAMAMVLFLCAGTLDWPGAWAFLAEMIALSLFCGVSLARHDPGLLKERLGSMVQKSQAPADRVLTSLLLLILFAWFGFMALDAVRFVWSSVPTSLQAFGALGIFVGTVGSYRVMRENSFAAPVVKIQKERGQQVISTGPYRYVRHPMYSSAILFFLGAPLLLGSWWGVLGGLALILLLCLRILIEERALRAGLDGYDDYARRVPYRLIPHVW